VPILNGDILSRSVWHGVGGIVEQHVDPPESLAHSGEQPCDSVGIGDIRRQWNRSLGGSASEPGGLLQRGIPAAGKHHRPTVIEERERAGAANAATSAGDDGNLVSHACDSCEASALMMTEGRSRG
jgi:hypothetical protein